VIEWVGSEISTIRKAKTVTFKGTVLAFLGQYHVSLACSELGEVNAEILNEKIKSIAGTKSHVKDQPIITENNNNNINQQPQQPQQPKQPPTKSVVGRGGASLVNNPKSGNIVNTANVSLKFVDEDASFNAIKLVRKDDDPADFVLFAYENDNPSTCLLRLVASGSSGIQGIANAIENPNNATYYGLLRVNDVVVHSTKTVKFVFIIYMGEQIKTIQRAKLTTHKGSAQSMIGQVHCDLFAVKLGELTQERVMEKVNAVTFN